MTTFICFLLATMVSVAAMIYLLVIDAKRRRVFAIGDEPRIPASKMLGWVVLLLPGFVLAFFGQSSAMLCWLGGTTVIAWIIAARVPRGREGRRDTDPSDAVKPV